MAQRIQTTIVRVQAVFLQELAGVRFPLAPPQKPSRATFQSCVGIDVTSSVVASIYAQKNRAGNAYRVLWRRDGLQRSLTFENLPAAERFKTLLEDHGPDEALRIIELDVIGRHVPTVTDARPARSRSLPKSTRCQPRNVAMLSRPHAGRLTLIGPHPFATSPLSTR
jgi:hypothetical protein